MEKQMKVFRMDDCQWVAHYSEKDALRYYQLETGLPINELQESFDDWGEVPLTDTMFWEASDITEEESKMDGVVYVGNSPFGDSYQVTFEWVINNRSHLYPGYIACTEY